MSHRASAPSVIHTIPLIALFLLCVPLFAQQSPETQKPTDSTEGSPPLSTFRSRSDLVLVPVVVRDHKGKLVSGLSKSAFRLEQKGKEQAISLFEEVQSPSTDAVGGMRYQGYSNIPSDGSNKLRLTIIVLDLLNTGQLERTDGKDQLLRFLSRGLPPNQPVSLLCITSQGLKLVQPFTADTRLLIEALEKTQTGPPTAMPRRNLADSTIRQLREIAQAYAGIPGRKTMIFAAGYIPELATEEEMFESSVYADSLRKLWQALIDANVSVYPFQLLATARDPTLGGLSSRPTDLLLRQFAWSTGGGECIETHDLFGCLGDAVEDSRSYYMLGFTVHQNDRKPGWRDLKVKVSAEHVDVRARNGFYYGLSVTKDSKSVQAEEINALASSLAYSAVPMYVKVLGPLPADSPKAAEQKKSKIGLLLTVPLSSVRIDNSSANSLDLDVGGIALTSDLHEAAEFLHPVRGSPKQENLQEWMKEGIQFQEKLDLPPGSYDVRVLVRDNNVGQIGTVVFPLEVK